MATKIVIELNKVWKTYDLGEVKVDALRGLTLSVHEKEFLVLMGPSGSGKSTAMNMIGCLDIPTKGVVKLDGKDISKLDENHLAKIRGKKIGFVFQEYNLIPTLTAFENVQLPMIFQEIPEHKRKTRAKKLLDLVGLSERAEHYPKQLSGGEQQRVAIARALSNDPEIILADEPTGNLDSKTSKMLMDLLRKLHKQEKKTLIIITHDKFVANYADKKVHLVDGRVK